MMPRRFRRWFTCAAAAATLFAALLLGFGWANADEGEQTAATVDGAGQPTELVAEIPEEYDRFFVVQWSGGSLSQLKAHLAVQGCLANTIFLYDDRWYGYNQFDIPPSLNQPFVARYGDSVPSGMLWSNCADPDELLRDAGPIGEPSRQEGIVAPTIPEDYGRPFPLRWAGGSLYSLYAHLAVLGCIADTIVIDESGRWRGYSRFSVSTPLNRDFFDTYSSLVPAGTMWAGCIDLSEHLPRPISGDGAEGTEIQTTQVVAEVPAEYYHLFPFRWAGGSLYSLYAHLAVLGCIADTIVIDESGRWRGYSRFSVSAPLNQQFFEIYTHFVPAGAVWADCVDLSERLPHPISSDGAEAIELQPTQVIAEVPAEYNQLFPLQWGGGSLYHLKARLATMGCMANTIVLNEGRQAYNQYNVDISLMQEFSDMHAAFVVAGTLWADCINICTVPRTGEPPNPEGRCLSWTETQTYWGNLLPMLETASCTDEFHPTLQLELFPILPLFPRVCITRPVWPAEEQSGPYGSILQAGSGLRQGYYDLHPAVYLPIDLRAPAHYRSFLDTEVHELCHLQQSWYTAQQDGPSRDMSGWFELDGDIVDAKREFVALVGFQRNDSAGWGWQLPRGSIFTQIYSVSPIELSAELCSFYVLDQAELQPRGVPNVKRYLTPDIVEWLEKYMVLPAIEE